MAIDATTSARVKELLEIDSSDTTYDTILGRMVDYVSRRFENYIDREFESKGRTEEYSVQQRQSVVFLRHYPVTAIASVKSSTDWDFSSVSAYDSDNYHVDAETGMLHLKLYPSAGPNSLQVSYTAGFAADTSALVTSHPDIAFAADLQTAALFRRKDAPQGEMLRFADSTSKSEGPVQLLPDVVEALAPYRRLRFGS